MWLEDFALFMALKKRYRGAPWQTWESALVQREPDILAAARSELEEEVGFQKFLQYLFDSQWSGLYAYARSKGITIVGDLPIYVSEDSSDVWANPSLFELDEHRKSRRVAGVPPDYFSPTGQRWGNPLYDWEAMKQRGYDWWIARFRRSFELFDVVRIDHFRGFEAYWAIPAQEMTAVNGTWVKGPGKPFFDAIFQALGYLPLIAEDLGVITREVEKLRDDLGMPGMRVLQFAFDGSPTNLYLPHNHCPESVVYTGTHDNDTTVGWFESMADTAFVDQYLGPSEEGIHWRMIREACKSVARQAIFPLQDLLGLGSEARMNRPGHSQGSWHWRVTREELEAADWERLRRLVNMTGR